VLEDTLREVISLAIYWECETLGHDVCDCLAHVDTDIELERCLILYGLAIELKSREHHILAGDRLFKITDLRKKLENFSIASISNKVSQRGLKAINIILSAIKNAAVKNDVKMPPKKKIRLVDVSEMSDLSIKTSDGSLHPTFRVLWIKSNLGEELQDQNVKEIEMAGKPETVEKIVKFVNGEELYISMKDGEEEKEGESMEEVEGEFKDLYSLADKYNISEAIGRLENLVCGLISNCNEDLIDNCSLLIIMIIWSIQFPSRNLTYVLACGLNDYVKGLGLKETWRDINREFYLVQVCDDALYILRGLKR